MKVLRAVSLLGILSVAVSADAQVTKYVRYAHRGNVSYGILEGEQIHELDGSAVEGAARTGKSGGLYTKVAKCPRPHFDSEVIG